MAVEKKLIGCDGVIYNNIRSNKIVAGNMCIGDEKITLKGWPKFVIQKGSLRFGSELQISVCAKKGSEILKQKRNITEWDAVEICIPINEGKELIKMLYEEIKDDI